jgi:putative proteasome-type protease
MTYCLALKLRKGLVFASDSRTTAGADYISTYRKMHVFQPRADRMIVLLTSGSLATTQEVLDNLQRDLSNHDTVDSLASVQYLFEAARCVGKVLNTVVQQYAAAMQSSGFDARATLIVGGQIGNQAPELYMVYPEGNYVAATWETPFLQLGEFKYGKPILSRLATPDLTLEDAARLALISFDAAMKSNPSVGPPVELAIYPQGSFQFSQHLVLAADSELLRSVCLDWSDKLTSAFHALPKFDWEPQGVKQ